MSVLNRWQDASGAIWVTIHCGCCGFYFDAPLGGTCFCSGCMAGEHKDCKIVEIKRGIKK